MFLYKTRIVLEVLKIDRKTRTRNDVTHLYHMVYIVKKIIQMKILITSENGNLE